MRFYLADKKGLPVWECTSVDDMDPFERRLWPIFWKRMHGLRASMVPAED